MADSPSRVLLLDDDPLVTRNLEVVLKLDEHFEPTAFNCPKAALQWLDENTVEAILVDFQMPEMTGIEFLAEAKKAHPEVTRIMLTGYADKESAIEAINEIGLYQYLEKPWDNGQLTLTLRNAVERTLLLRTVRQKSSSLEEVRNDIWRLFV